MDSLVFLSRMVRFVEVFGDRQIVATLPQKLGGATMIANRTLGGILVASNTSVIIEIPRVKQGDNMKRIPSAVALMVVLQSSISGSAVFAQSGEWKPGDPVNLGHVHKPYGEDTSDSFKYSYTPSSTSNAAASHSQSKDKTHRKQAPAPAQVNTSMTPVYRPEEHAPGTPPYTATNRAPETTKPTHTPGKLRNALRGIGNVIKEGSSLLASPSTNSPGNVSGAPMSGPSPSSSNGLTGVSNMLAPPGGYSSSTPRSYNPGSNPATNFFLRP